MTFNKKKIFNLIKLLLFMYASVGIAVFYFQDKYLLHPAKLSPDFMFKFDHDFKEVNIPINEIDTINLIQFLPKLKKYPILFVEQPMPAYLKEEYVYLKKHTPFPLMADESVLDRPDMSALEKQFHGINMKLMKAGGYLNGLRILNEARRRKMKTMVGCMVETTLGIHSAWNLCAGVDYADLDGCLILANEPFEMLNEENGFFREPAQLAATP
jgi:hypothetical protein